MDFIGDPFRPLAPYILATALALARMLSLMLIFPVFDRLGVTGMIRNSVAIMLSIPIIPMIVAQLGSEKLSGGLMVALLLKEGIVGLVVGAVLAVPLYAAEVAGDILDLQRGSSSASISDPLGSIQANITGSLLDTIVRTGLVLVGPFVVSMLLVDLLFALIARAAPSLQPFYLSMTVKNLVFSLVLVLYSVFLVGYMKNGLVVFLDAKPQLEAIAPH